MKIVWSAYFLAMLYNFGLTERVPIPEEIEAYLKELHDLCLSKMGLTEDDHVNYDISNNKDPKMMCYMQCLMKTAKWMDTKNVIQYDYIRSTAPAEVKDLLLAAVDQCTNIPEGTQECEKAYNFNVCLMKADPQHWFFV